MTHSGLSLSRICLASWRRDTRANTIMLFALMVMPIVTVLALAIDSSRQVNADRHVQFALDAASLVGVLALEDASLSDGDIRELSLQAFRANLDTSHKDLACLETAVAIDRARVAVQVKANCKVAAMVGGDITPESLSVANSATAQATLRKMDLAMMLDVSGSMGGEKLEFLKMAAKDTAKTLFSISAEDQVRLSFVSFGTTVNAGIYGNLALGRPENDDRDDDGLEKVCVTPREGFAAWRDDAPILGKRVGRRPSSCPSSSILPLTANLTEFNKGIDSLIAGGWTGGQVGVAWSWYLISPKWSDIWPSASKPLPYEDAEAVKAVILMTDGAFNSHFGSRMGSSSAQAKKLCRAMRDGNVVIYAVAFQAPASAKTTLRHCAHASSRYFEATTGEELLKAYAAIASQLSALTLTE